MPAGIVAPAAAPVSPTTSIRGANGTPAAATCEAACASAVATSEEAATALSIPTLSPRTHGGGGIQTVSPPKASNNASRAPPRSPLRRRALPRRGGLQQRLHGHIFEPAAAWFARPWQAGMKCRVYASGIMHETIFQATLDTYDPKMCNGLTKHRSRGLARCLASPRAGRRGTRRGREGQAR